MCTQILSRAGYQAVKKSATIAASASASGMADVPPECPEAPENYQSRPAAEQQLKDLLLQVPAVGSGNADRDNSSVVKVLGMGGAGKSCLASVVVRDPAVRRTFSKVLWVGVGLESTVTDLQSLADLCNHKCLAQQLITHMQ